MWRRMQTNYRHQPIRWQNKNKDDKYATEGQNET